MIASLFKIIFSLRIVLPNSTDLGASFLLWAITASLEAIAQCALTYLAQTVAKYGFPSVHPAAITVNVFRENGRIIQFGPQFRCLLPQCLVIILCGDISIALLAIQPADGNQSLHKFRFIKHKGNHFCRYAPTDDKGSGQSQLNKSEFTNQT